MPDGRPITVSDVFGSMKGEPTILLACLAGEPFDGVRIERHVIMV